MIGQGAPTVTQRLSACAKALQAELWAPGPGPAGLAVQELPWGGRQPMGLWGIIHRCSRPAEAVCVRPGRARRSRTAVWREWGALCSLLHWQRFAALLRRAVNHCTSARRELLDSFFHPVIRLFSPLPHPAIPYQEAPDTCLSEPAPIPLAGPFANYTLSTIGEKAVTASHCS